MNPSPSCLAMIRQFEGLRLQAYSDVVDVWTIGYGHTEGVKIGQVITHDKAEELLKQDCEKIGDAISALVKVPIEQHQFDALVSFVYNVGIDAFTHSTLLRRLNAGDKFGAASEFLRWDKADGHSIAGLTRRRIAERDLFVRPQLA